LRLAPLVAAPLLAACRTLVYVGRTRIGYVHAPIVSPRTRLTTRREILHDISTTISISFYLLIDCRLAFVFALAVAAFAASFVPPLL
jgi:hypothetical protein